MVDKKNQSGGGDGIDGEKLSVEKDMFKLLCYKAEVVSFCLTKSNNSLVWHLRKSKNS